MTGPLRILYVDDDPALLELGKIYLERSRDLSVITVDSAHAALHLLKNEHFDAVISDYQMPEVDGIAFLKTARKTFGGIPFILFTGKGREDVVIQAIDNGADAYVQKGGEPRAQFAELSHRVRKAVERVRAEQARNESEDRYRQFFRTSLDSMFITTAKGRFIDFNDALVEMFGYGSREEMSEVLVPSIYAYPEERAEFLMLNEPGVAIRERLILFKKKDGTHFYALLTFMPQRNADGSIRSFIGTVRDTTEQKRVETAMRENKLLLQTLVDTLPDLVWFKDPDGVYRSCNRRFESFFGAAEKDIVGKTDYDFMSREKAEFFRNHDKAAMIQGRSLTNEEEITFAQDGHREILETIKTPLYSSDGKLSGVLGISRNITERKRAEEALRQANKKLSLLSGIARHDITNQMVLLKGYLAHYAEKQVDPSQTAFFRQFADAVQRITDQIRLTRQYDEIGANEPAWQACRAIAGSAGKAFLQERIAIINDLPDVLEVYADPLMEKVFYALIENAVRYGKTITTIHLFCETREASLAIVCEDDGTGVMAEDKEKIFSRGFGKNTGFGLFLSREILSITGISIRETGIYGKGARFLILVPPGAYRYRTSSSQVLPSPGVQSS